jgi:hypothetical protein
MAVRMTRIAGEKLDMSNDAFSRNRWPIGGTLALVLDEASWRAGQTWRFWVTGAVKRIAWRISPAATSS